MNRSFFLRQSLFGASSAALASLSIPLPARALLPTIVFDPAAYAKIVNELTNTTLISSNTLHTMTESYEIYSQLQAMNTIDPNEIIPLLAQYDTKMVGMLDQSWLSSNQAKGLYDLFQTSFPTWSPAQPYMQLYALYQQGMHDNIRATTTMVQTIMHDSVNHDTTLAAAAAIRPKTVSQAIEKTNQILVATTHAITDLRGIMAAQFRDESGYYQDVIAKEEATRGQAATMFLSAALGNASDKLVPSSQGH